MYILSGTLDAVVPSKFQDAQKIVYETYGANVKFEKEEIGHVFPVDYPFLPYSECDGSFYLCNNGFDSTGKILSHLLTNIPETGMTSLAPKEYAWKSKGVYRDFNQHEFTNASITGLKKLG